jgi:integrase
MQKLLSVPNRRIFTGYRNYIMLLLFWDTMIRLGELLRLKVSDVDLKAGMIKVYGKGRKERCIRVGTKTIKAIHYFLAKYRRKIPGDSLGCKADGHGLPLRSLEQILERIGKKAGGIESHTPVSAQGLTLHCAHIVPIPRRLFQQQHFLYLDMVASRHAVEIDACSQFMAVITPAVPFDCVRAN